MKRKIILPILLFGLLSLTIFVIANNQGEYDQGYSKNVVCGNNVCEKIHFSIGQNETQVHDVNNQKITFRSEKASDGRLILHVNDLTSKAGQGMKDRNEELKSKYGFIVSSVFEKYKNPSANYKDLIVTGYDVQIKEKDYCPQDCMQELGKIYIEKGWNILSKGILDNLELESNNLNDNFDYKNDISAVYQYIPNLNKYILKKPAPTDKYGEKIYKEFVSKVGKSKAEEILGQNDKAFWVYSKKAATIYYQKSSIKLSQGVKSIKLFKGWNFLGFNEDFFEGRSSFSWDRIKGNCNYEKIYEFNPKSKEWISISPQENSSEFKNFFGMGMLIKVSNDCSLNSGETGESGGEINPPTLPN